ncbi:MAG TPA: hypothetical protein VMT62_14685 [Syntrophorhabdaceae bacterium]|nr:hypothetical protein [Syntrophorhabdaceae bacterium]
MKFEYKIKIFTTQNLKERGIEVDSQDSVVYACRPDGACEVHNVTLEQLDNLSEALNEMGAERWELVQLVFHQSGIVSFWKRVLDKP